MSTPTDTLITYPCDFPIKVMGLMQEDFTNTMIALTQVHDPAFDASKVEMRPSSKGNYLSLTLTVHATSREQLDNLYRALSTHPSVKYVL